MLHAYGGHLLITTTKSNGKIEAEVATINKDDAATIIDYTTEYMEKSMGWPDADDQTTFNNQIANN